MKTAKLLMALFCLKIASSAHAQVVNRLDTDLKGGDLITAEQQASIARELDALRNNVVDHAVTVIGAPDYPVAREKLQKTISKAITNYIRALDQIETEVDTTLSKLDALRIQASKGSLMQTLYFNEMSRMIPKTDQTINNIASNAIRGLLLTETYPIAVRKRKGVDREELKSPNSFGCVTGACVMKISDDLRQWFAFVAGVNQEISFLKTKTTLLQSSPTSMNPFVTKALYRSVKELASGPKANVRYSLAEYFLTTLKKPAALITGAVLVPSYLIEKIVRITSKLFTSQVMKLKLSMDPVDTYSLDEITEGIIRQANEKAADLPAVLYDKEIDTYVTGQQAIKTPQTHPNPVINAYLSGKFSNCAVALEQNGKNLIYVNQTAYPYATDDATFIDDLIAFQNAGICKTK